MVWLGPTLATPRSMKPGMTRAAVPNTVDLKNEHWLSIDIDRGVGLAFSFVQRRLILDRSLSRFAGTRLKREADRQ